MIAKSLGLIKQTNPQILQVLQSDSEVLARIQDSFHVMVRARNQEGIRPIEITCFFEELPLPGIGSVSKINYKYYSHYILSSIYTVIRALELILIYFFNIPRLFPLIQPSSPATHE
jgi:hypothetical protein